MTNDGIFKIATLDLWDPAGSRSSTINNAVVGGIISRHGLSDDFYIAYFQVITDSNTLFIGKSDGPLANGARVTVKGTLKNSTIQTDTVEHSQTGAPKLF